MELPIRLLVMRQVPDREELTKLRSPRTEDLAPEDCALCRYGNFPGLACSAFYKAKLGAGAQRAQPDRPVSFWPALRTFLRYLKNKPPEPIPPEQVTLLPTGK